MKSFLTLLLVVFLSVAGPVIGQKRVLKACGHPDYPPWNWKHGDRIVGVCADVATIVFGNLGFEVDHSYIGPWSRCQEMVKSGEVDINICAFKNKAREAYSDFMVTPMGFNKTAVFVLKGQEFVFSSWDDLKGKRVGMVQGVSMGQAFDSFVEENTLVDRVATRKQNYDKLAIGRIDLIATGLQTGLIQAALYGYKGKIVPLKQPIHPIEEGRLYISMSKKSKDLQSLRKAEQGIAFNDSYPALLDALLLYYTDFYVHTTLGRHKVSQ